MMKNILNWIIGMDDRNILLISIINVQATGN